MAVSSHLKWLVTGGPDGVLILRATGAIVSTIRYITVSLWHAWRFSCGMSMVKSQSQSSSRTNGA